MIILLLLVPLLSICVPSFIDFEWYDGSKWRSKFTNSKAAGILLPKLKADSSHCAPADQLFYIDFFPASVNRTR